MSPDQFRHIIFLDAQNPKKFRHIEEANYFIYAYLTDYLSVEQIFEIASEYYRHFWNPCPGRGPINKLDFLLNTIGSGGFRGYYKKPAPTPTQKKLLWTTLLFFLML